MVAFRSFANAFEPLAVAVVLAINIRYFNAQHSPARFSNGSTIVFFVKNQIFIRLMTREDGAHSGFRNVVNKFT
jgi:hypothetical protein